MRPSSATRSRRSSTGSSARNGFAVTRDERLRLVEEVVAEIDGLRAARAASCATTRSPRSWSTARARSTSSGAGKIERVDVAFLNDEHVLRIIDRIITPLGRRIDQSSPRVDARLPDGSRVNAIIEPLSLVGPVITIRKFSARPFTVDDLVGFGTATAEMFDFLQACVEARLNIFVSGGTGSGKTTTLNVLSSFIPEDERIITIEDAAELQLRQSTSSRWRRARRTSRARARSRSATCCATPCTCAPTGSSSASAAAARPWT